jgi:hypothetical protein
MTDAVLARPSRSTTRSDALFYLAVAFLAIITSVAAFAVWTPFGFAATFLLMIVLTVSLPAGIPVVIACALPVPEPRGRLVHALRAG